MPGQARRDRREATVTSTAHKGGGKHADAQQRRAPRRANRDRSFAGCTERQFADVAHLAAERDLERGAELCAEGEFEQEAFVVLEGEASATVSGTTVGSVGPGEVVGGLTVLGDGHRKATLVAPTPMRVLVLGADDIVSVLATDPDSKQSRGPRAMRSDDD